MPEDYYTTVQAGAPLEQKYSGRGNYEVSSLVVSMPGTAMQNLRLWYPAQLEQSKESWPPHCGGQRQQYRRAEL